jgi:SIR2-like domain
MELGQALTVPVDATIVVLVDEARNNTLAICGGAGISIPAGLPSGRELAQRLDARFQSVAGYQCSEPTKLLAVADAAAKLPDGLAAVQRAVLALAPFSEAAPQLAHRLLALLLAEDAVRLLLTNWDDCVERSWREFEQVRAVCNSVEAESLRGQFVVKIHGCCTQPDSLLITSAQLRDAPLWTRIYFAAQLARSTTVFVGIGDIADYARTRIAELAQMVDHARVRVVSPGIGNDWGNSGWKTLLPELPEGRRIPKAADTFLDELAREWVKGLVAEVRAGAEGIDAPWLAAVAEAFERFTAVQALFWLRRAAVGWEVGESIVRAPAATSTLEAIGLFSRGPDGTEPSSIGFIPNSAVQIGEERVDVLICKDRQSRSEIEEAAVERAQRVAQSLGPQDHLHVLVAAGLFRGPKPEQLDAVDIVDLDVPVDELIDGDRHIPVRFTWVADLLEAA